MSRVSVVVGAGVFGTSVAHHLARRGHRVILLEQYAAGHARGSSHGPTRIFRLSYPDATYVRLAQESQEDWKQLEADSGESLLHHSGGLDMGESAQTCARALEAAGAVFEWLEPKEVARRFPLRPPSAGCLFQQVTGVLAAGRTVEVQRRLAERFGAEVQFGSRVRDITPDGDSVFVTTDRGRIVCDDVVVAAGPWTAPLALRVGIDLPVRVTAEEVAYLLPSPPGMPVVIDWDSPVHYLAPAHFGARGMRVGLHHAGREVDPDQGPFEPTADGVEETVNWVKDLTGEEPALDSLESCLYTNTPTEDFILHARDRVLFVSACSGHGFKFAPRIGRAAADIVTGDDPRLPIAVLAG